MTMLKIFLICLFFSKKLILFAFYFTEISPNMGKLENLRPAWKKGESGNPKGKPKGIKNRATIVKKWLEYSTKENNPLTGELENLSQEDLMTLAIIEKAKMGDVSAYKALKDDAYAEKEENENNDLNVNLTIVKKK